MVSRFRKARNKAIPRTARQGCACKGEAGKKIPAFKAALANFLSWSEREHRAHTTHTRYKVRAVALRKHFVDVQLDRITPEEVERYKTVRSAQVSPRTKRRVKAAMVNRELACLKTLFNHILKGDVALRNPVS
jgi:site-specific recombinase XerD